MANEDIVFSAKIDDNGTGAKSLASLKKEFKDLQLQLEQTQQGTAEYQKALERLGAVRDDIGDLRDTINSLNPEGKVAAFVNVAGKLAGGFQAATGAAALFGVKAEDLEKTLLRVQAATAFAEGIQSVVGLGDAFRVLGTVIESNPILLVGAAIAAATVAIISFEKEEEKAIESIDDFNASLNKQNELFDTNSKAIDINNQLIIEGLKQRGANEKIVNAEIIKQNTDRLETLKNRESAAIQSRIKQENYNQESFFNLQSQGNKDQINLNKEKLAALKKQEQDAIKTRIDFEGTSSIEGAKIRTKETLESIQKAKEESAARIKAMQDLLSSNLKSQQEYDAFILAEQQKTRDSEISDAQKQVESDKNNRELLAQYLKNAQDEEDKREQDNKEARAKSIKEESDKNKQLKKEQIDADIASTQAGIDAAKSLSEAYFNNQINLAKDAQKKRDDSINEQYNTEIEKAKKAGTLTADFKDAAEKRKIESLKVSAAAELKIRKQQFEVEKAFSIARAVIDGIRSVQAALTIPPPAGPILAAINGVLAVANIAKIASTRFDPGTSAVDTSIPSSNSSVPSINIPSTTQPSTRINADGTINQSNGAIEAYVVETSITKTQNNIKRIQRQTKF